MNRNFKALTLAIIAMFCFTAVLCIHSDTDSSASDTVSHNLYFEIVNDKYTVADSGWVKFTSTTEGSDFASKANAAFAAAGYAQIKCQVHGSNYIMFNYGSSVSTVCYVGSSQGDRWVYVDDTSEYLTAKYIGLGLDNGYISDSAYNSLSDVQKRSWTSSGMGGGDYAYMKILEQSPLSKDALTASSTEHKVYFEIIDAKATVTSNGWVQFTSTAEGSDFASKANAAFAAAGYPEVKCQVYGGNYIMFNYGTSVSTVCYIGSSDGKDWSYVQDTSEYLTAKYIGLGLNYGYISDALYNSLSDEQKQSWTSSSMGGGDYAYMKILGQKPVSSNALGPIPDLYTGHIYVEVIDENGKVKRSDWFEFTAFNTLRGFAYNATQAFANGGLTELEFDLETCVLTYDGKEMTDRYYADGKKWVDVTDVSQLYSNEVTAVAVGHALISKDVYDKLSDSDKEMWKLDSTSGQYMKIIDVSTTGFEPSSGNDNMGLIIGIVVAVVVVVVVAGVFFYVKKK